MLESSPLDKTNVEAEWKRTGLKRKVTSCCSWGYFPCLGIAGVWAEKKEELLFPIGRGERRVLSITFPESDVRY